MTRHSLVYRTVNGWSWASYWLTLPGVPHCPGNSPFTSRWRKGVNKLFRCFVTPNHVFNACVKPPLFWSLHYMIIATVSFSAFQGPTKFQKVLSSSFIFYHLNLWLPFHHNSWSLSLEWNWLHGSFTFQFSNSKTTEVFILLKIFTTFETINLPLSLSKTMYPYWTVSSMKAEILFALFIDVFSVSK